MISKERNMSQQQQKGFSLIELMIVIAIIGILAALALPTYQTYAKKAKFSEVVMATTAVKSAIDICYQTKGSMSACKPHDDTTGGSKSVLAAQANAAVSGAHVDTVTAEADLTTTPASISITAIGEDPVDGETYILLGTDGGAGSLLWDLDVTNSTCLAAGLCDERG
jgi:type IV pilus assembly protein PilA